MRKRFRSLRGMGSVPFWFRTHMLLGVAGPVLILFHANFRLGALNSNVAFFAMLIVAISGVIGRYIYGKIHMGLHGGRARVKELVAEAEAMRTELGQEMQAASFVSRELAAFSKGLDNKVPLTALGSLRTGAIIAARTRRLRANVVAEARRLIRAEARLARWSWSERRRREKRIEAVVRRYAAAVRKAAELTFFERLFSLWHVLHLPLFFLMLLAGVVHVWAVHHY
ncbi:pyridine nucleotide-disulfide oxidoreductase [Bradyrhizobium aeschynomenes]|uniref:pyridine nucleotide-disulfide oxidoreductase n=1 Tax=Bradyrhizobium aeschynomenes TaxID=2734909 RepID=UPI001FEE9D13|nr:pyridine nucleotide-disulfide oxidoreductase [Bradyrhizobium aeschynomenes]